MNGRRGYDLTQYISATFPLSETISTSCRVSGQLMHIEVPAGTASNLCLVSFSDQAEDGNIEYKVSLLRLQKEVFLPEGYFAVSNFTKDSIWGTCPRKGQKSGHCTKELSVIFCVSVPSNTQYAELEEFDLSTHF